MALRMPVVEIPIDDAQFRRFAELFALYEDRLEKSPGVWQKVNKEFRQSTAAILAQNQSMKELGMGNPTKLRQVESGWRSIAGFSGAILGNTMRITQQLLKWGTIFAGGLVGGSLWGLTHMAGDVAGYRRQSKGLGMSIGGMRSFDINMSRFVDPVSFLSSINQAVSNPALQGPLYAMGVNPNGSTEQVSLAMLKAMRRLALSTPRGELGLMSQAYGLGPFGGLETLMRLQRTPASEFYKQLRAEQGDRTGLGLPPGVAGKWQEFTTQMERARSEIFKTFVVGLEPLAGPLTKLSAAFSGFLSRLMSGPILKQGVDKLADWLNKFSVELTSQKFQAAVANLVSDTGTIAKGLHHLANAIKDIEGGYYWSTSPVSSPLANPGALGAAARDKFDRFIHGIGRPAGVRLNNPGDLRYAGQPGAMLVGNGFAAFRTPQEGLTALGRQLELYGSRGNNTLSGIISKYAPPSENDTAAYIRDMVRRVGVSASSRLDLSDPKVLASLMQAMIRHEVGYNPYSRGMIGKAAVTVITPDSGIVVTARHKSGANAVLSAAGLAGVPQ